MLRKVYVEKLNSYQLNNTKNKQNLRKHIFEYFYFIIK